MLLRGVIMILEYGDSWQTGNDSVIALVAGIVESSIV